MSWFVLTPRQEPGAAPRPNDQHVIPDDDLRPHDMSVKCWCHPVEDAASVHVFVHNALDGRVFHEDASRLH